MELELTGERIKLRKARMSDLDAVSSRVYCDAELLKTMFMPISENREEAEKRLERTIGFQKDKPLFFVALRETDEVIGLGGIFQEAPGIYSESGLAIARAFQHRGYGKELLGLLLDLAFTRYHAECFAYYCMEENLHSKNLARHFGFRYDSTKEELREYDQKTFRVQRYLLTREEYLSMTRRQAEK